MSTSGYSIDTASSNRAAHYRNNNIHLHQFLSTGMRGVLAHMQHDPEIIIEKLISNSDYNVFNKERASKAIPGANRNPDPDPPPAMM